MPFPEVLQLHCKNDGIRTLRDTMPWVALDGSVGAGKTTTLRLLRDADTMVLVEPVGDPAKKTRGIWDAMLHAAHEGVPNAAFELQSRIARDRALSKLAIEVGQSKTAWALIERSPDMRRRICAGMEELGPEQRQSLAASYDAAAASWRTAGIVYLRLPPDILFERTKHREHALTMEQHLALHAAHEAAVVDILAEGKVPVSIVDAAGLSEREVAAAVMNAYKKMYVC